jgi:5-(carboxyamino)imidazole ribonucleotide synthase
LYCCSRNQHVTLDQIVLAMKFDSDIKIGILGGGQLGRMLIQSGMDFNLNFSVMDPDPAAPCRLNVPNFVHGDIQDFEQVYRFGKGKDLLTIEIENVNCEALEKLEREGVKVFPQPSIIKIIQDKRLQKQFYKDQGIPTSEFVLVDSKAEIENNIDMFPVFQKLGKSGYDGRGVYKLENKLDINDALEGPSVLEKLVDFEKELSVIVARNERGEVVTYPVVEMVFHPTANLVEFLFAPARISEEIEKEARAIARKVIESFDMVGLLAVEMFLDKKGNILVNEVAPRPHNSGHQTIKANFTSQYEQLLRSILGLPLGNTDLLKPAAMINLLGESGFEGIAVYEGVDNVLKLDGVYLHLYGKKFTKPYRKMGHVTVLDDHIEQLIEKANIVKDTLKVKS